VTSQIHKAVILVIPFLLITSLASSATKYSELYFSKGVAEFNEGRFEQAFTELQKAAKEDPKNAQVQYYLGLTQIQLNDLKGAIESLKRALELDPSLPRAHYDLGTAYYKLGEYDNALKEFRLAQEQEPNRAMIHYYQGYILHSQNRFEESTPYLKKAAELDPNLKQSAQFFAGLNYLKTSRLSEAESEFNDAYKTDPSSELGVAAKSYLDKIAETRKLVKRWDIIPSYSLQYDDNVVLEPDRGISPTRISDEGDFRQVWFLATEYRFIQKQDWLLAGRYTFYQSLHASLHDYDLQNHQSTILTAYRGNICGKIPYRAQFDYRYNNAILNEHRYLGTHSGTLTFDFVFRPNWITQVLYRFQDKKFYFHVTTKAADRDAENNLVGFNQYLFFSGGKRYIKIGYAYDHDNAIGHNWDYDGHRVSASLYTPLIEQITMNLDFDYWNQEYNNTDTFFNKKRNDEEYTYSVSLDRNLTKIVSVNLKYTHITHDSNITFYDYRRNIVALTFTARF
jgi:tetratricopeptide (TPR) repeat protein